jgi:hypothetical protein
MRSRPIGSSIITSEARPSKLLFRDESRSDACASWSSLPIIDRMKATAIRPLGERRLELGILELPRLAVADQSPAPLEVAVVSRLSEGTCIKGGESSLLTRKADRKALRALDLAIISRWPQPFLLAWESS